MKQKMVVLLFVGALVMASPVSGGWMDEVITGALKKVGERAVEDATDGAYEGTKRQAKEALDESPEQAAAEQENRQAGSSTPETNIGKPFEAQNSKPATERRKRSNSTIDLPHFSGRMVTFDPEEKREFQSIMYVGGANWRMEPLGEKDQGITIMDFNREVVFLISPAEKTYLEIPFGEEQEDSELLYLAEGANPCPDFRISREEGQEMVGGRAATKWVCRDPLDEHDSAKVTVWIDKSLKFLLRSEDSDGYVTEIRDIRQGKQPAELFQIPAGYKKTAIPLPFFGSGS